MKSVIIVTFVATLFLGSGIARSQPYIYPLDTQNQQWAYYPAPGQPGTIINSSDVPAYYSYNST